MLNQTQNLSKKKKEKNCSLHRSSKFDIEESHRWRQNIGLATGIMYANIIINALPLIPRIIARTLKSSKSDLGTYQCKEFVTKIRCEIRMLSSDRPFLNSSYFTINKAKCKADEYHCRTGMIWPKRPRMPNINVLNQLLKTYSQRYYFPYLVELHQRSS